MQMEAVRDYERYGGPVIEEADPTDAQLSSRREKYVQPFSALKRFETVDSIGLRA